MSTHSYLVRWEIDADGENPLEAAAYALKIQRDPESIATVFEVTDTDTGITTVIDMEER